MSFHSLSVTGVIDSRLPGRSVTMFASALWLRSSASGTRRVLRSARTSTLNQRGVVLLRRRVVVIALLVELRLVGVGGGRDLGEAGDARLGAARVVEQHAVADLHLGRA